jgi:hypothetical protein
MKPPFLGQALLYLLASGFLLANLYYFDGGFPDSICFNDYRTVHSVALVFMALISLLYFALHLVINTAKRTYLRYRLPLYTLAISNILGIVALVGWSLVVDYNERRPKIVHHHTFAENIPYVVWYIIHAATVGVLAAALCAFPCILIFRLYRDVELW